MVPWRLPTAVFVHIIERERGAPNELAVHVIHSPQCDTSKQRSTQELSQSEVAGLMDAYCNFLFIQNVVSMSYMDEMKKGVKTGRMVLQAGFTKKLKKHALPKEVPFGKEIVPVQMVREGMLQLFCDCIEAGAYLRVTHGEMWRFGTLGAQEERVWERTRYRIVSCAHVLTDFDREKCWGSNHCGSAR